MSLAKTLKTVVKGKQVKDNTFGTNPSDPWSARANLAEESEEGMLKRYLLSRGIDPRYVSKDTRISHSKSGEFLKWKQDHMNDNMNEAVDQKDTITFDIPLLIRVLEFAREELKTDVNLHKMVERLISMRGKGTLTMNQYGVIVKEEYGQISEDLQAQGNEILARHAHHHAEMMKAMKSGDKTAEQHHYNELNKAKTDYAKHSAQVHAAAAPKNDAIANDYKQQEKIRGIGHVRDHVEVDGTVVEAKEANYGGGYQASVLAVKAKAAAKPVDMKSLAARMQASYAKDDAKKTVKEDTLIEAPNPKEVSKSARMIKAIYKKQGVTKDNQVMKNTDLTDKPQAAAVLSGGKTMTGSARDTIEIDPMLRKPKGVDKNPPNSNSN